jgi:hypothetical protein
MTATDPEGLAFFNRLSITLRIELDPPAQRAAPHMLNLVASPDARVTAIAADVLVLTDADERELTNAEGQRVVLRAPSIHLQNLDAERRVEHRAPDGSAFTVRDLIAAIVETERQVRSDTRWVGGVDVHHVFFEGIEQSPDGTWQVAWGS